MCRFPCGSWPTVPAPGGWGARSGTIPAPPLSLRGSARRDPLPENICAHRGRDIRPRVHPGHPSQGGGSAGVRSRGSSWLKPLYFYGDIRGQILPGRFASLDLPDHLHAFDHFAKGRKALTIRVAPPTVIQLWLVVDANEELGGRTARFIARHGEGSILMCNASFLRRFMKDGR